MVNRALLNDAIQRALQKSDWFELDTYFKNVVEGIEDFQVFYELLPNFLRQVFGYEQVGFLDNLENFDMKNNSTIRYLGPRSNFFSSLEKSSSNFTFFFPVTNLPVWLQRAIEEKQSPVNSPNGEVRPALGKDAFLAFCKERLRKSAEGELELNATEYFLFCLIANTYWKRDFQVFEGDSMVSNRTFHPAMELKQFLNPKQQGSGKDQNQHCLRLEKWQFLHLLYLYIVYFIPRNEMLCLLNGRDIYFIRKYGELFWRLFCNFYIFTEEALTMGSLSLPSKFTFCVLTVAISYIRPSFGSGDQLAIHGEGVFSSNKKELKLFSTEDAWNSSIQSIFEYFHVCSQLWSESQLLVDFIYLACCIFVMATPWMPIERWLNIPHPTDVMRLVVGSNRSPSRSSTKGVAEYENYKQKPLEGMETLQQQVFAVDSASFISRYKDSYGALIPFVVRKAAVLGAFKNMQFFLLLKTLSNCFHCRTFEEEDSLFVLLRDAHTHISETYNHSLYSLSKSGGFCTFPFFHQGIYRDLENFQGETLKILFESWKQWRPSSRIGMVLQSDIVIGSSAAELRFPREFLKEFRGLFLILNLGTCSSFSLVEYERKPANLTHRPSNLDRSSPEMERSRERKSDIASISHSKGAIRYRGDPWMAPICSYESESLVCFLYRLHLFLRNSLGIDVNFRFLASYIFILYTCVFFILSVLLWRLFR